MYRFILSLIYVPSSARLAVTIFSSKMRILEPRSLHFLALRMTQRRALSLWGRDAVSRKKLKHASTCFNDVQIELMMVLLRELKVNSRFAG